MPKIDDIRKQVKDFERQNNQKPQKIEMGSLCLAWIKEESWCLYHDFQPFDRKNHTLWGIPVQENINLKTYDFSLF